MTDEARPPLDETALASLRGTNGVLAPTDDGTEDILVHVRRVAAKLAAELDTTLYLADRSVRTWTETPHVRGPADVDELRRLGVGYMVTQMEEALAMGAPAVNAVAPSIPNFDAVLDSVEATHAGVVVIPTELDHLRFWDRVQLHGDLADKVAATIPDRRLVVVDRDGSASLR